MKNLERIGVTLLTIVSSVVIPAIGLYVLYLIESKFHFGAKAFGYGILVLLAGTIVTYAYVAPKVSKNLKRMYLRYYNLRKEYKNWMYWE